MKEMPLFLLVISLILTLGNGQTEEEIDDFIETVLNCTDTPGLSLTVIKDGQEYFAKGYGIEDIETQTPVTSKSLFLIASVTKAFGGVAAAIVLKNTTEASWITPIRDILGEDFYLNDALRTQHATLNDLFGHRMGFPSHNPLRIAGYTLEEMVSKLRFLEFAVDFRVMLNYNNVMYGLAEYVVETLDGRKWKEIVREEIYEPLGMDDSSFMTDTDDWDRLVTAYYLDDNGELREVSKEVPLAYYSTMGSAGSLCITADDMGNWMLFQLNQGTTSDGTEILTPVEFGATHVPLMHILYDTAYTKPEYPVTYSPAAGYATGWYESTYRGYQIQQHGGSMGGYTTHMVLLPDMGGGVFVAVNGPDDGAKTLIAMHILDHLLGVDPWVTSEDVCDYINSYKNNKENAKEENRINLKSIQNSNIEIDNVRSLDQYVGVYGNYAYGNVTITIDNTTNGLVLLYGVESYAWDLTEDTQNHTFTAQGREPFWYWSMAVNFESDGTEASSVVVWFDAVDPPRFDLGLDYNNPPPPPELCPE